MQWIRIGSPVLLFTLLTACSGQSSTDKLTKELDTVKSWTATAQMVGDAWSKGTVPEAYAKQTLAKTQEELKKSADTLSDPSIAASQRRTVLEQLKHVEDTVAQMSTAMEQKNRTSMAQQMQQLATEAQAISTLEKTAGGQS